MSYLFPDEHAPAPTETAVLVPLPAAEPLVGTFRDRFDAAAGWGVPAHVTVVYPFADPSEIDELMVAELEAVFRSISQFDVRLARTNWFAEDVLWLDPEPDAPFRRLTSAVVDIFPQYQPYRGVHDDVVPHLTIGDRQLADPSTLRAAEQAVQSGLPIAAHADRVLLIAGTNAPDSWRTLHEFRLSATQA